MFYKNILASALALLVIFSSPGSLLAEWSDFYHEYTKTIGGEDGSITVMNSVVDLSDNVYLTGHYSGTVDFNPSEVVEEHSSNGGNDIFLTKINADGTYGYTKTIGGNGAEDDETEGGRDLAIDSLNNIYMVGYFLSDSVDFDSSEGEDLHSSSSGDGRHFLTKINADGSYGYTYAFNDFPSDYTLVDIDPSDNIYVSGNFVFDGEAGYIDIPSQEGGLIINFYESSTFLIKLNADESYEYTILMGSNNAVHNNSISIDSVGNIYLSGYFAGLNVDFDPYGDGDEHSSNGGNDIFLTKINADGSYGYTKTMGGVGNDSGVSVVLDSSDNVYLTGHYSDTVDFDPNGVGDEHTSNDFTEDIFLTKINADDSYGYTKTMGGENDDRSNSVTVDSLNNVYISGYFAGLVDFDPIGDGDEHSSNTDSNDIFITKINADASYGGTKIIGGDGADAGVSVVLDSSDNVYLAGHFAGTVDFDPSAEGIEEQISAGTTDVFLAKFSQVEPTPEPVVEEVRTSSGSRPRASRPSNPVITQNPVEPSKPKYVYNLKIGTDNANLKDLQKYLEDNGFSVDITTSESDETTNPSPSKFKFLVDFKLEANIPDVKELQKYLNANGFPVSTSGPGSVGNESTYFGLKTKSALMLFQKSKGLVPDGVMGPITRGVINAN